MLQLYSEALQKFRLAAQGHGAQVQQIEQQAKAEIDAAVAAASAAPPPEPGAAYTDIQTVGAGVWA